MNWLKLIFGAPLEMVGGIIKGRQAAKVHKRDLAQAIYLKQMQRVENGDIAEVQWNNKAQDTAGWRANWVTLLLSAPLILIFGPDAVQEQIADGFTELAKLPDWYKAGVGLMVGSAFGYQKYTDKVMNAAYSLPAKKVIGGPADKA